MRDFESDWYGSESDSVGTSGSGDEQRNRDGYPLSVRIVGPILGRVVVAVVTLMRFPKTVLLLAILGINGPLVWGFVDSPLSAGTEGVILRAGATSRYQTVGFTDMNGQSHEFTGAFFSTGGREVGESVDVFYNPDDPTEASVSRWPRMTDTWVFAQIMLIWIALSLFLIRRFRDWERRRSGR